MFNNRLHCDCFFICDEVKIKCLSVADIKANLDVVKRLGRRSCTLRLVDKDGKGVEIDFDCVDTGEYQKIF